MSIKILSIAVLAVALSHVKAGTITEGNACSTTSDCVLDQGLECRKFLEPCDKGTCACPDGQSVTGTNNKCAISQMYIGDACTTNSAGNIVVNNAECSGSKVACSANYVAAGVTLCLKNDNTEALVGAACADTGATCFGYVERGSVIDSGTQTTMIECAGSDGSKTCQCMTGYKKSGNTCVAKILGDACGADADCRNTATQMTCSGSSNTKCACPTDTSYANGVCKKILGDACADNAACRNSATQMTCTAASNTKCECPADTTYLNDLCQKTIGDACANAGECRDTATYMTCTSDKCACKTDASNVNGNCVADAAAAKGSVCVVPTVTVFAKATTCTSGLSCTSCPGETTLKCLKAPGSAGVSVHTLFHLLSAAVISILGRAMV